MDKNAIKKYAVWARRELIERVAKKAQQFGIEKQNIVDGKADTINDKILTASEKRQRQALIATIKEKEKDGYEQVIEEVAYTWFNRFSALRFMEVNGYLPSHVRVFTDEENNFKPQILTEAIHLDMDGLDMEKVYALKDSNKTDELYKYLLITQCNALNSILPGMFQKIEDYTELLFPDNLLREGSVIEQMVTLIPEDDWKDAVQIIGWLYQYYNSEKKDDVFAALKRNVKIAKENIPAATQLFTPDWIVRYMVENSLGRLWLEGHPNDELKSGWKYYLDEVEQDEDVQLQFNEIRKEYASIKPEEIKCIDPCSGSGHILVYMFDVLMQIYEAYGYTSQEAVVSIVKNNIYGLDIDERASQLASFSVMMKARQYDRRFFRRKIQPNVHTIIESNQIDDFEIEYYCNGISKLKEALNTIIFELNDAKEYGSILKVTQQEWGTLYSRFTEITEDIHFSRETVLRKLLPLIQVAELLSKDYHIVATNPPYMGNNSMSSKLISYSKKNYPESKTDLFAMFIERCKDFTCISGYQTMITQHVWMFLSSYERLRDKIEKVDIINMVHLGAHAFEEIGGEVVQTTSFVFRKKCLKGYKGKYCRLIGPKTQQGKEELFLKNENCYVTSQDTFLKIPGKPIAYWVSNTFANLFTKETIRDIANACIGMRTGNNERFLRLWYEVDLAKIGFGYYSAEQAQLSNKKWIPYNKGGEYRKWYGNNEFVVNWENNGFEIKENTRKVYPQLGDNLGWKISNEKYYFREGISWTVITSKVCFRRYNSGFIFSNSGQSVISDDSKLLDYLTGTLNSKVSEMILKMLSPTLGFESGYVNKIPVIIERERDIVEIVNKNILISKMDWDSFETSWDFRQHPLLTNNLEDKNGFRILEKRTEVNENSYRGQNLLIKNNFENWMQSCEECFNQLKANEEEINRIFIDIYGLQGELNPEVEDKDITIRMADLQRDIKSLISYAVGCMFGRYSLNVEGLVYAGGEWDDSKYITYPADKDNIIPICDDEYFEDDIASRFMKFIEVVYGKNTLQENLNFIADALGGKGQPKEVIRSYFLNNFYKDHCKIYQKRPIYWQFDSGKKNGFKCLIYMHRYEPDTIARIRTDYVHEQQSRYRTAIEDLEQQIMNASTSERVKLNKKLLNLQAQASEIREYEEKIHHLADQMIRIDLDDGVKKNYEKFKDVLAKIN